MTEPSLPINFNFEGSKAEYLEALGEVAAPIAASPGLRWNVLPWNCSPCTAVDRLLWGARTNTVAITKAVWQE